MEQSLGVSPENLAGILSFALTLIFYCSLAYFWCFENLFRGFKGGYKVFNKITTGKASEHWDSIKGKIIEVHIVPSTFQVELKYSFNLNGELIEGNRISFNERYNDPSDPNSLVNIDFYEKYPLGDKIIVFYDKTNPRQSTLEKGIRISELSLLTTDMSWVANIFFGLFVMKILIKVPFYTFFQGLFNELSLL